MDCIREQGHGVCQQTKGDARDHEAEVQCRADRESAIIAASRPMMVMIVAVMMRMVVHALRTMPQADRMAMVSLTDR
jgi:hypothetical protein